MTPLAAFVIIMATMSNVIWLFITFVFAVILQTFWITLVVVAYLIVGKTFYDLCKKKLQEMKKRPI